MVPTRWLKRTCANPKERWRLDTVIKNLKVTRCRQGEGGTGAAHGHRNRLIHHCNPHHFLVRSLGIPNSERRRRRGRIPHGKPHFEYSSGRYQRCIREYRGAVRDGIALHIRQTSDPLKETCHGTEAHKNLSSLVTCSTISPACSEPSASSLAF